MDITRRQLLVVSLGTTAAALAGLPVHASADEARVLLDTFTGGVSPVPGGMTLTLPEVAENGNTVPLSFSVESAMDGEDLVESVLVVADGNPRPDVATFHFTALSAAAAATTRIRLAQSQTLTAVARMKDGSFRIASTDVSVTVGGCTG